jgi:electron transfer flavoprotein alpha subunit
MNVLIYSENDGGLKELVTAAREIGADSISAAVIGTKEFAELARKFVNKVYFADSEKFGEFRPAEYAEVLNDIVKSVDPDVLLVEGSPKGVVVASILAAKLDAACVSEASQVRMDDGADGLIAVRSSYGGVAQAEIKLKTSPSIVCLKPGSYPKADEAGEGEIEEVQVEISPSVEVVEVRSKEVGLRLEDAEVVVVAGRGVKKKEDLSMLEELAEVLGGAVGVTRPLSADLHWAPNWVGMSGVAVKPKLYVGVGVSGQIQHIAGVRDSKTIIAINSDPNAPIFEHADYGIIGDLYAVVPKLLEKIKEYK